MNPCVKSGYAVSALLCLLLAGLVAGCSAPGTSYGPDTSAGNGEPSFPAENAANGTVSVVQSAQAETAVATPTPTQVRYATYSNPGSGLTIRYPEGWTYDEPGQIAFRDYGRTTLNIVNFYTPTSPGYCVFSVDIDSPTGMEIEDYFNKAVLAHQEYYGPGWDITKHNFQSGIPGWPGYRLDFMIESKTRVNNEHGIQVYVYVGTTPYIFTYRGPESIYKNHLGDALEMLKQIEIVRTTRTAKSR